MNQAQILTLKAGKILYSKLFGKTIRSKPQCDMDPDSVSEKISKILTSPEPCMIARFGANELSCIINFKGITNKEKSPLKYIKGKTSEWWWNQKILHLMNTNAGLFPGTKEMATRFSLQMLKDISEVDILGSWLPDEILLNKELSNAEKIRLMYLDPYWSKIPWTKVLKGKKILVVHPFAESIRKQYAKRELLFSNPDILPEFESLKIIKAVQSIGRADNRFYDWFEALEFMKQQISACDFDICLIGCGAYGFPLAAHVKRLGKKAVHIGGSLQLLFGIRGKRWDNDFPHYTQPGNVYIYYKGLSNENWIRPSDKEKPQNHKKIEDSCYW